MVQRLIKNAQIVYSPGTPGVPGVPPKPYLPARQVVERQVVCGYYNTAEPPTFEWRILYYDALNNPVYGYVQTSLGKPGGVVYECREQDVVVSYPAQYADAGTPPAPGSPSQLITDFELGWSGRAHSIPQLARDGTYKFTVPEATVGAVVGLSRAPAELGYGDILWGFQVAKGVVRILESGNEVAYLGAQPGAELSITRRLGKIQYRVAGTLVRTTNNNPDPMVLAASLYAAGDAVDGASFTAEAFGESAGTLAPLSGFTGTQPYAVVAGRLPAVEGSVGADPVASVGGDLPALTGITGSGSYGMASGALPALNGQIESTGFAPSYALASSFIPAVGGGAVGFTGTVGAAEADLPAITGWASQGPYGAAAGSLRGLVGSSGDAVAGEVLMFNGITALQNQATATTLLAVMNEYMEVEGLIAVQPGTVAALAESLGAEDSVLTQSELRALLASVMSAQALQGDPSSYTVWALNMTINGSTRYENYAFNSLAKIGNSYYGASADGLFKLSGADDAGQPIDAQINFGNLNFGTSLRKALPYVYAGMASDGRTVLKVVADGKTYYYDVRATSPILKEQRFELGRGLRATYYDITLINEGGSAFELADIEFAPVALNRRL